MSDITRRDAMWIAGAGAAAVSVAGAASSAFAQAPSGSSPPAFAAQHQPKPLRFDPARLPGLSENLIRSHWENNYQGSVKALNTVEQRLAAAMADNDFPPILYGDIKREELHRTGSVVLHELYFDGLGGDGKAGGEIARALASSFSDIGTWEAEFRRTAMSLAGGSGWAILAYNQHTGSLHNYWAWDHMHGSVTGIPLLALDMYEHSYHMDYGTQAAKYVDAFMANVDWEVVDARYQAAHG
jgi:superoxide dismutase, Fe-Mn family